MRLLAALAFFVVALTSAATAAPSPPKPAALVIGNAGYLTARMLSDADRDAREIAAALKAAGVTVREGYNLKADGMAAALAAFQAELKPGGAAIVVFAGYALQGPARQRGAGLDNYLLAVDAAPASAAELEKAGLPLSAVLAALNAAGAAQQVVILDAARPNPFAAKWAAPTGLAEPTSSALRSAYVAMSAAPGVGLPTREDPSLFAVELAARIGRPGVSISQAVIETAAAVQAKGAPAPWSTGSGASARLVLNGAPATATAQAAPAAGRSDAQIYADAIACGTKACLEKAAGEVSMAQLKADLAKRAASFDEASIDNFDPLASSPAGAQAQAALPAQVQAAIKANEGTATGQLALGAAFLRGDQGFPQDNVQAFSWFMKAELRGDATAAYMVGWFWNAGQKPVSGVDQKIALDYFQKAAARGSVEGVLAVAEYYEKGLGGLPKDMAQARALWTRAAAAGSEDAKQKLRE